MGLFDSDYEFHGSVSSNQLAEQRAHDNTFYGELMMLQPVNGRNMADEIRYDIMHGVTKTLRDFRKTGEREQFFTSIGSGQPTDTVDILRDVIPGIISANGSWKIINGYSQAMAEMCQNQQMLYDVIDDQGPDVIGIANFSSPLVRRRRVEKVEPDIDNNLEFTLTNGGIEKSDYSTLSADTLGWFGVVDDGKRRYYYISKDERLRPKFEDGRKIEALPIVSLQDNGNNEEPYYLLGEDHDEYIRRQNTLDALGIDFGEMSKQVFDPEPIPDLYSDDWEKDYAPTWDNNEAIRQEYGTEENYQRSLVIERQEMMDTQKNITDVHVGMFCSPKTLDWSNVYAMTASLQDMLPNIPSYRDKLEPGQLVQNGGVELYITAGSLKITHSFERYSLERVIGKMEDYRINNHKLKVNEKGKVGYLVLEDENDFPDPGEPPTQPGRTPIGGVPTREGINSEIALAIKTGKTDDGRETFQILKLIGTRSSHYIDVIRDGDTGQSGAVVVEGSVVGYLDAEYSDVILFPITRTGVEATPIFKRERLMRETTIMIVSGIQVVEVEWWQKGVFKIVFFIAAVVVSCYISACSTIGAYIATAGKLAITSLVIGKLLEEIENPFLAAIAVVVAAVITQDFKKLSLIDMAVLGVEATGTYLQKQIALEMVEKLEEFKESQKKLNEKNKELEENMEENGFDNVNNTEYILEKAIMPPLGELAEDFFERALKRDFSIIKQDEGVKDKLLANLPNRKV